MSVCTGLMQSVVRNEEAFLASGELHPRQQFAVPISLVCCLYYAGFIWTWH